MAAAQSELSMDEILASIRKIIHDEEDPRPASNPDKTNTVDLRKPEPAAPATAAAPKPVPAAAEAAPAEPAEQLRQVQVTAPATPDPAPALQPHPAADPGLSAEAAGAAQAAQPAQAPKPQPEPKEEPAPQTVATMEPDALATERAETEDHTFDKPAGEKAAAEPQAEDNTGDSALKGETKDLIDDAVGAEVGRAFAQLRQGIEVSHGQSRTLEDMVQDMMRPMLKAWLDQNLKAIVEQKVEAEIAKVAGRKS
jgi:cell pole-organizing protein PopZ